ncbi:hypothetical protein JCM33374_g4406 [Metschnikowia sp. JCM 33374]|nr:hypothetical protein JCM33374_g4406 [Metschnikowia sp. JCM 33374]
MRIRSLFIPSILLHLVSAAPVLCENNEGPTIQFSENDLFHTLSTNVTNGTLASQQKCQHILYKRSFGLHEDNIELAERFLSSYVNRLKSFVHETYFDAPGFETASPYLGTDISDLKVFVRGITPRENNLMRQFKFARRMYRAMLSSSEQNAHRKKFNSLLDKLLRDLNELSIMLMALYKPDGNPDLKAHSFEERVSVFMYEWKRLKAERALLKPSSSIKQLLIDMDFARVYHRLEDLRNATSPEFGLPPL